MIWTSLEMGADWIALSFVQRPEDVLEARALVAGRAAILSKLEKPAALERLDEIVAVSDAIMVARGDLGVELPPECVPGTQKRILRACLTAMADCALVRLAPAAMVVVIEVAVDAQQRAAPQAWRAHSERSAAPPPRRPYWRRRRNE